MSSLFRDRIFDWLAFRRASHSLPAPFTSSMDLWNFPPSQITCSTNLRRINGSVSRRTPQSSGKSLLMLSLILAFLQFPRRSFSTKAARMCSVNGRWIWPWIVSNLNLINYVHLTRLLLRRFSSGRTWITCTIDDFVPSAWSTTSLCWHGCFGQIAVLYPRHLGRLRPPFHS